MSISSILGFCGYLFASICGHPRFGWGVPPEKVSFFRRSSKKRIQHSINILNQVDPVPLSIFGHYTFLTTQTNLICTIYFACCCLKDLSPVFASIEREGFALAFGLGQFLTIAYYALDHYNPESIKRRKYWSRHGYPHCGLNGHLVHFGSLPLSLLHMILIRPGPSFNGILFIVLYMTFFVSLSVYNRLRTGKWQYPILEDVQRSAGFVGCLLFVFFLYVSFSLSLSLSLHTHTYKHTNEPGL